MHWEVGAAPACKNLSRSSWKTLWPHLQGPGSLLKQSWSPDIIKDIILVQFSRLSLTLINGAPPCLALMPEMGRPSRAMSELCDFAAFFSKRSAVFFSKRGFLGEIPYWYSWRVSVISPSCIQVVWLFFRFFVSCPTILHTKFIFYLTICISYSQKNLNCCSPHP